MISIFLHLLVLGFATVHFRGYYAAFPLTALIVWTFASLVLIYRTIPDKVDDYVFKYRVPSFIKTQSLWQWAIVIWILTLQAFADPLSLVFPGWFDESAQFAPMLLSVIVYVIIAKLVLKDIYRLFKPILNENQTADDFFRARMTIPMLFLPPMLFWMLVEELAIFSSGITELQDVKLLIAAPVFFIFLYLLAPRLFNWAWKAEPMHDEELKTDITKLCQKAETPISGVKIWNTFNEPIPNAAVAGLSQRYRFVYITRYLLDLFSPEQIKGVIAHELAHLRLGHVLSYMLYSLDLVFLSIAIKLSLVVFYPSLATGSPLQEAGEIVIFLAVFGLSFTALARECEYQADAFAATLTGKENFAGGLETLQLNIMPPPKTIPAWLLTHPQIQDRIDRVYNWSGKINDLLKKSRKIRFILVACAVLFFATAVPAIQPVWQISKLAQSIQAGNPANGLQIYGSLPEWLVNHPLVIRESGKLAMITGKWDTALIQASRLFWNLNIDPDLKELHHTASPEVTFNFKLVQFMLQFLDLRRVHSVSLFK